MSDKKQDGRFIRVIMYERIGLAQSTLNSTLFNLESDTEPDILFDALQIMVDHPANASKNWIFTPGKQSNIKLKEKINE